MIHGVHLVDFTNHKDSKLSLSPLTALVGENGAGKTNLMRAILEASNFSRVTLGQINEGLLAAPYMTLRPSYRRVGGNNTIIALTGPSIRNGRSGEWALVAKTDATRGFPNRMEGTWLWNRDSKATLALPWIPNWNTAGLPEEHQVERPSIFSEMRDALEDKSDENLKAVAQMLIPHSDAKIYLMDHLSRELLGALSSVQYFKAQIENLSKPSYPEELPAHLLSDGRNLASALSLMMTSDRPRFDELLKSLRAVVPAIRDIKADRVQITRKRPFNKGKDYSVDSEETVPADHLIFDMASGRGIRPGDISEGTLLTLGLLTLIHSDSAPDVILLDDIERGLHPRAQRDLMKQLRSVLKIQPKLQIILSSHSPYIIDQLAPEEVWLMAGDKDGCAVVRQLSQHPNAKRALEVLSTGEFWSAEGESWIVDEAKK